LRQNPLSAQASRPAGPQGRLRSSSASEWAAGSECSSMKAALCADMIPRMSRMRKTLLLTLPRGKRAFPLFRRGRFVFSEAGTQTARDRLKWRGTKEAVDSMVRTRMPAAVILFLAAALAALPGFAAQKLPSGVGCAGVIDSYQGIVKSDLATGNVEQQVYDAIERELSSAAAACQAGHDGQARAIVAASKERHGYHN